MADAIDTKPVTVQSLAEEARKHFEKRKRRPDDEDEIWFRKDDAPEWVATLVEEAHGDMGPDDWRYAIIVDALDALADEGDADMARDNLEADVYTHDLTAWLHSRADRGGYVNDAREEYGSADSITDDLQRGQLREKEEVFDLVHTFLDERADELND